MSITIIGGLTFGTILTLLVVPMLYSIESGEPHILKFNRLFDLSDSHDINEVEWLICEI
jgi:hypothetical protein